MKNLIFKLILVFVLVCLLVFGIKTGKDLLSEKIRADFMTDMANKGYYQKEIDGKILWTKDGY